MTLEQVVRPFTGRAVDAVPFAQPGSVGAPLVHVVVGLKGGTTTFNWSYSAQMSTKMGEVHKESAPQSQGLKTAMNKLAAG